MAVCLPEMGNSLMKIGTQRLYILILVWDIANLDMKVKNQSRNSYVTVIAYFSSETLYPIFVGRIYSRLVVLQFSFYPRSLLTN